MHLHATAQDHVAAYLEYHRIVGDDDGGTPFTDKEYAEYTDRVRDARVHRVYCTWQNAQGMDCRNVGPQSSCECSTYTQQRRDASYIRMTTYTCPLTSCACAGFCGHRYIDHDTDRTKSAHIACKKCACALYSYLPKREFVACRSHVSQVWQRMAVGAAAAAAAVECLTLAFLAQVVHKM